MSQEQVTETKPETPPEVNESVLKEAESQGWVPKEKFRGDENDWVDADTFVKRGREIMPILRKNNENLLKELNTTKEQLKEFKKSADEFKKFQQQAHERKVTELNQQLRPKTRQFRWCMSSNQRSLNFVDEYSFECF